MRQDGVGFMCLTDYEFELGNAQGGSRVFASEKDLRRTLRCVDQCGIAEVRVSIIRVVQPANYSDEDDKAA